MRVRLVLFALLGIFSIVGFSKFLRDRAAEGEVPAASNFADAPPVRGILRVSSFAGSGGAGDEKPAAPAATRPRLHRSSFVNGPAYSGMEDNDLRGFLDGTYKYAWNQPTQIHVRVGRRPNGARWGEYEIFRVVQRWAGIELPPNTAVRRAELQLTIERGPADSLRLFLYEVRRDWNPGTGGTLHDNVSPPVPGEVWWNDAAYAESSWALPGVGYASDVDPLADTGAMPLAEALWTPGEHAIKFESEALAECVTRRVGEGRPIGFLVKLADPLEDLPGTMLTVYSGNEGDSRNSARRPRLTLEWEAPGEFDGFERSLLLEHGRAMQFPAVKSGGGPLVASFFPEDGSLTPTFEWSEAGGESRLRVGAVEDPLVLGLPYRTQIHDTWIRTAAPEEQRVPWVFVSPSGLRHKGLAHYDGDRRWSIEFTPDEIGRWHFDWSQHFAEHPYQSPGATFDVVGGDLANLRARLGEFAATIPRAKKGAAPNEPAMARFARLERAVMLEMTSEAFRSAAGESTRAAMNAVREALGGAALPDSIPMTPDVPPEWAKRK